MYGTSTSINSSISQNIKSVKSNSQKNNIQDFGEKIGGARKDLSEKRNSKQKSKEVIHDYTVETNNDSYSVNFKGKMLKEGFKTQTEAEKYILDFKENINNNKAFVKDFSDENNKRYLIYLRNPRTLKSQYAGKEFFNKQDAENYAIALSMYLKENGKNLFRPQIQKIERNNPNNKNSIKATGNDILENFGFKGGEFGNWVKQDERQQFLNYALDAFTDLSIVLDIDPKSLGQNGQMSIAFGARGQGLTGAVAHYEPMKKVINMTRLKGAGSLSHEYGHSIDNYLSRLSGYNDNGMATTNFRNPNLSENMQSALNNVIDSMRYNISTDINEINKKNSIYEENRKNNLDYYLKYIDKVFNDEATTYKYNRKTKQREQVTIKTTQEQKEKYQDIRKTLEKGNITENYRTELKSTSGFSTVNIYPEPINTLQNLYKEVVGRKLEDDTVYGIYRNSRPARQIKEVKTESAFSKSARELDKLTGRATAYFSKIEEMWARAFESYVSDKLKSKGIIDTYLVHSVNNNEYALFNPFPAGEERKNINAAFDNLINTMKEEGYYKPATSKNLVNEDNIRYMKKNNTQKNTININNTDSSTSKDTRFAKKSAKTPKVEGEILEPGQTNAQRGSNYIEQEIRKIEESGNWDDSIPVTKMTDIRKTIEDYLGIGVQKGHFRQQAYGIYKGNRDVIRTKELKDMDTILHETGHALDIGKRINLNKETISDELLKAVSNYGGYEAETRDVQLEEGFAEVIREYTIVPNQARIDYPQTVAVLEGIRQTDKDFNKFITNVQQQTYNYIHQNPRNRGGLSNQSIGERTDRPVWSKEYIRQVAVENAFDSNYALKRATQVLQQKSGSKELRASENAYLVTRLISGIGDKVTSMLSDGYIDESGNKLFPGLNQLGEILNNDAERFNDLRAYLVARRHMDYVGKNLKTGIRTNDARAIIEQFQNDTQIQEAAKVIYDTLDGVLQYAVNNKLITEENAQALRESNAFYVPMQRVIGTNGNNVGRKGAVADIIKARTGSELDIKDVLENIVTNSANIIQQVENNRVINALYTQGENAGLTGAIYDEIDPPMKKVGVARLSMWKNELKKQGVDIENIDFDKTMDIFIPNNNIDERQQIVSFIDNKGQRRYLQFHDEILFKELTGLDRESISKVLTFCNNLNKPLRYGATLANLGFALPNMISDTVQASIYSEAGFIPLVDTALGAIDVLTGQSKMFRNFMNKVAPEYAERVNKMYALYLQSGATNATKIGQERKSAQSIMKDIYGTKNSKTLGIDDKMAPLKRLLDIMTYIPELSEQSTRFRVFEKNLEYYRRNGMSELDARMEAAIQSRDATQDFSRMGKVMREVNKVVPFSAARVGSIYTFAEKMKANPKRTSARIAVLLAINMVLKSLTSDDDEIQELNQRKKDDNFVFKIGDQVITIKKPQGFLRSLINLTDYIHDLASGNIEQGKEGERLVNWLTNAIMDNSVADDVTGMVPSAITPLLENAINKDLYYNSDIVKSYDLDLPDSEQYYDYNSQLAIWLGQIFNYSPAKIDNFISGYFAGLGTQVTNIIDWIVGKTGATPEEPNMGLEGNSIGKRFFVNVNSNSQSVDDVYTLKTDLTKKANGGTITEEEEKQLEAVTEATSNMAKLNKQIKEIKKSLTLSADEKADQIRVLQQQKTDTARQALGKDLLYSENEEAIESTQFYPSRDTLSQNKRTLTLTSEMKKEYEKVASEYYQKYESQGLYSEEKLEQIKEKAKDYAKSYMMKKYKSKLVKSEK